MDYAKFSLQNHFPDPPVFVCLFLSVLTKLIFNSVSASLYGGSKRLPVHLLELTSQCWICIVLTML